MKIGKGNRRIDLNDFVESITDSNETYVEIGIVRAFNGQSHYELAEVNGKKVDIYIDCEIVPTGEELTARLCGIGQSGTSGIFRIPPPGTEVVIVFPRGEFDGLPYIIGISPSADPEGQGVPDELDGDTLVVANDNATIVVSHNGDITIDAKSGKVIVQASDEVNVNSSNATVNINGTSYHMPQWDGFIQAFQSFLIAPLKLVTTPLQAAGIGAIATTFDGYFSSQNNWFSTKGKNG